MEFKDLFYIVKVNNIYQLRIASNYECLSTSPTLEGIGENLKKVVERYGSVERLLMKWGKSNITSSKEIVRNYNMSIYNEYRDTYKEFIYNLLSPKKPILKPSLHTNSTNRPRKTLKSLKKKVK